MKAIDKYHKFLLGPTKPKHVEFGETGMHPEPGPQKQIH